MEIRPLVESDAEEVTRLRLASLLHDPESFGMSYEEESVWGVAKTIERIRGHSPDDLWIGCFDNERLTGMGSFQRLDRLKSRHKSEINAMYVTPESRGNGVGRQLLLALIDHARKCDGVTQIGLSVGASNLPARRLYESAGFEEYGLEKRALRVDGRDIDVAHMVLWLDV